MKAEEIVRQVKYKYPDKDPEHSASAQSRYFWNLKGFLDI